MYVTAAVNTDIDTLLASGLALQNAGRLQDAETTFRQLLNLHGRSPLLLPDVEKGLDTQDDSRWDHPRRFQDGGLAEPRAGAVDCIYLSAVDAW